MKGLETGKDKVKKICDVLRKETLEPAIKEAEDHLEEARHRAEEIIREAREIAERMQHEAREDIERQRSVFKSALQQACKQALEALRQQIEEKLFNPELGRLIAARTQDPQLLAQLIPVVMKAIEKEGLGADLSIYIPAAIPASSVNALLTDEVKQRLREKSVLIGPITGGIEVKLHKENMTIEISDTALKEVVALYSRKDLRELLFG